MVWDVKSTFLSVPSNPLEDPLLSRSPSAEVLTAEEGSSSSALNAGWSQSVVSEPDDGLGSDNWGAAIEKAAACIDNAFAYREGAARNPRLQRFFSNAWPLRNLVMLLFLIVSFFERPSWCYNESCGDPADVLRSGLPVMDKSTALLVELLCVLFFFGEMLVQVNFQGTKVFLADRWHLFQIAVLLLYSVDLIWVQVKPAGTTEFRAAAVMRPCFFAFRRKNVRSAIANTARTISSVVDVFALLAALLFFFGVVGTVVFGGKEKEEYFPSLGEAMVNLLVLLTTANFPDVMMPAYSEDRGSVLFFVLFLMVGLYFLLNSLLASVFKGYCIPARERAEFLQQIRRAALTQAFGVLRRAAATHQRLDGEAEDDRQGDGAAVHAFDGAQQGGPSVLDLVAMLTREMAHYSRIPLVEEGDVLAKLMTFGEKEGGSVAKGFGAGGGVSSLEELKQDAAALPARDLSEQAFLHVFEGELLASLRPSSSVGGAAGRRSGRCACALAAPFHAVMLVLVAASFVVVLLQTSNPRGLVDACQWTAGLWLETAFAVLFLGELVAKAVATGGLRGYLRADVYESVTSHVVEGLLAVAALTLHVAWLSQLPSVAPLVCTEAGGQEAQPALTLFRAALVVRLARGLRLLVAIPRLRAVFRVFFSVVPLFWTLAMSLFVLMSVFSEVGVLLFGGKIRRSNPLIPDKFRNSNYFANNFNDFASGMVTLFELLVVNNWYVLMDGFVAVTSTSARAFFIVFYASGVLLLLNLAVAFVLDAYLAEMEKLEGEQLERQQRKLQQQQQQIQQSFGSFQNPDSRRSRQRFGSLSFADDRSSLSQLP